MRLCSLVLVPSRVPLTRPSSVLKDMPAQDPSKRKRRALRRAQAAQAKAELGSKSRSSLKRKIQAEAVTVIRADSHIRKTSKRDTSPLKEATGSSPEFPFALSHLLRDRKSRPPSVGGLPWGQGWLHQSAGVSSQNVPQFDLLHPQSSQILGHIGFALSMSSEASKPLRYQGQRAYKSTSIQRPSPSPAQAKRTRDSEREPVVPPSPESGGIPEPTPAYLLRASFLPCRLPHPRPMLVVIDLNGTLLYRPNRREPCRFQARPHARAFLSYCVDTFHVVIWSSARERNVEAMCADLLTPAQRHRVLAVWGRDRFGLSPQDYARRVQCYKRLTRIWGDPIIAAGHPLACSALPHTTSLPGPDDINDQGGSGGVAGLWDQGNTVLIDDSAEKARSEPYNAIQIPEFCGDAHRERALFLPQVHDYLNTLACQQDISTYIRVHPFKAKEIEELEAER
ncbi:hypothetical protein VTK73DRAFT_8139 [Phialemonium thermophilum]|uniref:Mitochondrial import inner membrane translocase subunit TIM50 n=1 Tax=Phialemonium thermophilum TaxID=223376 RepID=A0ABR3XQ91_9PEZI